MYGIKHTVFGLLSQYKTYQTTRQCLVLLPKFHLRNKLRHLLHQSTNELIKNKLIELPCYVPGYLATLWFVCISANDFQMP